MKAACLFFANGPTEGPGDLGTCAQLCDCNSQCLNPAYICNSLAGTGYGMATGRAGVCEPPPANGASLATCPSGGTGGTGGGGGTGGVTDAGAG